MAATACLYAAATAAAILLGQLLLRLRRRWQPRQQQAQQCAASRLATVPPTVTRAAAPPPERAATILAHITAVGPTAVAASPFTAASRASAANPYAADSTAGCTACSLDLAPAVAAGSPFAAFAAEAFAMSGRSQDGLGAQQQQQQKQPGDGLPAELTDSLGVCPTPPQQCAARQLRDLLDSGVATPAATSLVDPPRSPSGCLLAWAEESALEAALPFPTLEHSRFLQAPLLTAAALPPALRGAVVDAACVTILRNADGSPQQLGCGARWVGWLCGLRTCWRQLSRIQHSSACRACGRPVPCPPTPRLQRCCVPCSPAARLPRLRG